MAVITGNVLPGPALDIMGRGSLPGWRYIEFRKAVLDIIIKDLGIDRDVPEQDIFVVIAWNSVWVKTDFHILEIEIVDEIGDIFFVSTSMTTVAIGIRLRVADLTLHFVVVDSMLPH